MTKRNCGYQVLPDRESVCRDGDSRCDFNCSHSILPHLQICRCVLASPAPGSRKLRCNYDFWHILFETAATIMGHGQDARERATLSQGCGCLGVGAVGDARALDDPARQRGWATRDFAAPRFSFLGSGLGGLHLIVLAQHWRRWRGAALLPESYPAAD